MQIHDEWLLMISIPKETQRKSLGCHAAFYICHFAVEATIKYYLLRAEQHLIEQPEKEEIVLKNIAEIWLDQTRIEHFFATGTKLPNLRPEIVNL